jgi:NAD(P)H-hydrate epimerase
MNCDENYVKKLLPTRPQESHKGTFGHVLNIAGSGFYTGAAYFSSLAPLKVGAGRSTLASSEFVLSAVSSLTPDVILLPIAPNKGFKPLVKINLDKFQAISIGCGLSEEKNAVKLFKHVLKLKKKSDVPLVIDADGLNILASYTLAPMGRGQGEGAKSPQNTILTPHPREMSKLMGLKQETILSQPEYWTVKCAEKFNATVVLKLHKTLVADNHGNFYENTTGNSALAHGGSGDVLCGMITGFLAQGLKPFDACCLAVYLHGLAGEMASEDLTEYSTLASDLMDYIPKAIKRLIKSA